MPRTTGHMSTSTVGFAKFTGATVYYIYAAPSSQTDLKAELTVLQTFVANWNTDKAVSLASAARFSPR
jgi:hypothetical protein